MTPVDPLDSIVLMGLREEAAKATALILDCLSVDRYVFVSNFEITIRLLAGQLSSDAWTRENAGRM